MLEHLLREDHEDAKNALNDEENIDQIITILNSGYETVSTTSMMAIKYLHDNQEALQELRVLEEHHFLVFNHVSIIKCNFFRPNVHFGLFLIRTSILKSGGGKNA